MQSGANYLVSFFYHQCRSAGSIIAPVHLFKKRELLSLRNAHPFLQFIDFELSRQMLFSIPMQKFLRDCNEWHVGYAT